MIDYSNSKKTIGAVGPENAIRATFDNVEPLLTPELLRASFLFGIPLVSKSRDPITGKVQVMSDELLRTHIVRAVTKCEQETHTRLMPIQYREKLPFDRAAFDSLGYMELKNRPIASIEKISVTPADGRDIYILPLSWVEAANFQRGQVNIIPLNIALTGSGFAPAATAGGAMYFSILNQRGWIPAYWQVEYTSGYPDGMLPREINELVGMTAAVQVLSDLAATDADATSRSLGIDGMSQSVGGLGPSKFDRRIEYLMEQRKLLIGKIRARHGTKLFSSHV
jgi:hypothetical protein